MVKDERRSKHMKETVLKVRATLLEDILGTLPADPTIYATYIASKAPDAKTLEQEIEDFGKDEVYEKGITVFARDEEKNPIVYDYLIKGFFKNACSALRDGDETRSKGLTSYKKKIDGQIFVFPRKIKLQFDGEVGICERPLRAQTPQGERVAIASSESIPAGTTLEFEVRTLNKKLVPIIIEWLEYGKYNGLGQWHNSGKGRFTYELLNDVDVEPEEEEEKPKKRGRKPKTETEATK